MTTSRCIFEVSKFQKNLEVNTHGLRTLIGVLSEHQDKQISAMRVTNGQEGPFFNLIIYFKLRCFSFIAQKCVVGAPKVQYQEWSL